MAEKTNEPEITINGVTLSVGQAMTLRVAATNMLTEMSEPDALGDDDMGRRMAAAYADRLREIITIMFSGRAALQQEPQDG